MHQRNVCQSLGSRDEWNEHREDMRVSGGERHRRYRDSAHIILVLTLAKPTHVELSWSLTQTNIKEIIQIGNTIFELRLTLFLNQLLLHY